jgi:adenylate cyclase
MAREQPHEADPGRSAPNSTVAPSTPSESRTHSHDFLVRLRPTLLTMVVGLVVLTALAIATSAALLMRYTTREEIHGAQRGAARVAMQEVNQLLGTLPQVMEAFAAATRRGALPMEDQQRMLGIFLEQVHAAPRIAAAGYGDARGWYVGAGRNEAGEIAEYLSPTAATTDGARPSWHPAVTLPFAELTRDWFQLGMSTPGAAWSNVHVLPSGGSGISCVVRLEAGTDNAPTGVFHVDIGLRRIHEFLSELRVGARGAVFLVGREGRPLVTPQEEPAISAAAAVEAAASHRATARLGKPATVTVGNSTYDVIFEPLEIKGNIGFFIAVVIDLADITDGLYRHAAIAAAIGLVAVILAIVFGARLASTIARPVLAIADDVARVGNFEISRDPWPGTMVREIDELGHSVERMKASLRSFAHYVPTDLVRRLIASGAEAELGGEIRRLTIHFSDVADFTTLSEGVEPQVLVQATGRYFQLMTAAITRHGGTVDKFMGDGIMAFFNAPQDLPDHPRQACLAALEAQQGLAQMACETAPGQPIFRARIGLHVGEALVGNIGTPDRFAYTLLGDVVNLASRLEGLNKMYGTRIMASDTVVDDAGDGFEWRRLDRVAVKGRHQGTIVCELLGRRGSVANDILHARDLYEQALDAYFAGDFLRAEGLFDQAREARPNDLAAVTMRQRSRELAADPPADWNGIHVMHEK